jgi:serine/threonine protein kinase
MNDGKFNRSSRAEEHHVVRSLDESPIEVCSNLARGVTVARLRNAAPTTIICKSIGLPFATKQRGHTLQSIKDEIESLRTLVHPHVVTLIGTFEERSHRSKHFYFLLMSPVGDNDLYAFLQICSDSYRGI